MLKRYVFSNTISLNNHDTCLFEVTLLIDIEYTNRHSLYLCFDEGPIDGRPIYCSSICKCRPSSGRGSLGKCHVMVVFLTSPMRFSNTHVHAFPQTSSVPSISFCHTNKSALWFGAYCGLEYGVGAIVADSKFVHGDAVTTVRPDQKSVYNTGSPLKYMQCIFNMSYFLSADRMLLIGQGECGERYQAGNAMQRQN